MLLQQERISFEKTLSVNRDVDVEIAIFHNVKF
jgi:hypothetical protein